MLWGVYENSLTIASVFICAITDIRWIDVDVAQINRCMAYDLGC